ncbi:DNA/RNA helicase domain-containing protein [Shewanella glacialipiscicola]|uniref:DNA/RNA helicase domain-containing protein n=1 Tax=Shewanella glacialipiscicola TaxID=614069 RepID=UPI0024E1869C|nr:DNA/RNA helicase domain-containing protein [Shewanella glacialipiscicola]
MRSELETIGFSELVQLLIGQQLKNIDNPDLLFNPSDYLVSPFNSTSKFLNELYFLTGQQETIKGSVIKNINATTQSFMTINGGPGTGKTLLTYDIVKDLKDRKNTLIVHCGQLNNGHATLISEGWNIIPIKYLTQQDVSSFDIVVVDETQRIYANQLDKLILDAQNGNIDCIFSYDVQQTLSRTENSDDIDQKISALPNIQKYQLSDKIRTNKEIASFIKLLFNNRRSDINFTDRGNVDFDYFSNVEDVRNYLSLISDNGWEVLKWTPSQYNTEHHESYSDAQSKTAHTVIGQEFDNVAVVIDRFFSYDDSGKLTYNARTYYDSVKMLFQNITRTRKKLKLIIVSNNQVLERCLSIMGHPE